MTAHSQATAARNALREIGREDLCRYVGVMSRLDAAGAPVGDRGIVCGVDLGSLPNADRDLVMRAIRTGAGPG